MLLQFALSLFHIIRHNSLSEHDVSLQSLIDNVMYILICTIITKYKTYIIFFFFQFLSNSNCKTNMYKIEFYQFLKHALH